MSHSHSSGDASTTSSSSSMMMVPYLHFTGGDFLFFKSITPTSNGAIAGAAVFLFFLAVFERYIVAMRSVMEIRWRQRGMDLVERRAFLNADSQFNAKASQASLPSASPAIARKRVIPPFIPSHDIRRGIMYGFQSLLRFALMLAIMTFQAAYIITIVAGLGIGEVVFGRLSVSGFPAVGH